MRVEISTLISGHEQSLTEHCERHGRQIAERVGARWPMAHEHAAVTKSERFARTVYIVRVIANQEPEDCEGCTNERQTHGSGNLAPVPAV